MPKKEKQRSFRFRFEIVPMPPSCYTVERHGREENDWDNSNREQNEEGSWDGVSTTALLGEVPGTVARDKCREQAGEEEKDHGEDNKQGDDNGNGNEDKDENSDARDVVERRDKIQAPVGEAVRNDNEIDNEIDNDPRVPMMASVLEEVRRTDNILVSEIGKNELVLYLNHILVAEASTSELGVGGIVEWKFESDKVFYYAMEIFQANVIHFLRSRYFDLERGRYRPRETCDGAGGNRHGGVGTKAANGPGNGSATPAYPQHPHSTSEHNPKPESCYWGEEQICEDFRKVFHRASASRYFPNKRAVVEYCFKDERMGNAPQANQNECGNSNCYSKPQSQQAHRRQQGQQEHPRRLPPSFSMSVRRALVRLHRRAGIYLPNPKPSTTAAALGKNDSDSDCEYWLALWWVCSSLWVWILGPCLEILHHCHEKPLRQKEFRKRQGEDRLCHARDTESDSGELLGGSRKRRKRTALSSGFAKQSRTLARIHLYLLQRELRKLGLPFDTVLMHGGPYDGGEGSDYGDSENEDEGDNADYGGDCDGGRCSGPTTREASAPCTEITDDDDSSERRDRQREAARGNDTDRGRREIPEHKEERDEGQGPEPEQDQEERNEPFGTDRGGGNTDGASRVWLSEQLVGETVPV